MLFNFHFLEVGIKAKLVSIYYTYYDAIYIN